MLNVYQNLIGRMTFKTCLLVIAVILFSVKNKTTYEKQYYPQP